MDGRVKPGHDEEGDQTPIILRPACLTQIIQKAVQPLCGKYSCWRLARLESISIASRPTQRGVSRSSRNAGEDAVDAAASARNWVRRAAFRERTTACRTNGADAYGKTVWSWHPLLVSSRRWRDRPDRIRFRHQAGSDGDKTNSLAGKSAV